VDEPPDSLLVQSARRGDVAACQELIRRHQDRVYTIAYSYVQDREEALDITQDTFLRMLEGLPGFREQASFRTWLQRIVVNRCLDWRRSRARRPTPASLEEVGSSEGIEPVETRASLQPHRVLENRELREQIQAAIAAVPEPLRTVVVLADIQGLAPAEVAKVLGCPVNTAKTRLHRARLLIRKRLEPYLKGDANDLP
jgi:RNA polymerase sigma factor (sigma-70 family)